MGLNSGFGIRVYGQELGLNSGLGFGWSGVGVSSLGQDLELDLELGLNSGSGFRDQVKVRSSVGSQLWVGIRV